MTMRIDGFSRVRAVLDLSDKRGALTDVLSGGPARFARGARVRFELLLKQGDDLADPSLIDAARLRILSSSSPDSALGIDATIGPSAMNRGVTEEDWDTGEPDKCHLRFELTASQTAEGVFAGSPLANDDFDHWLLLTYGAADDFLFAGTVKSFDAGTGAAGVPPSSPTAASLDQVRAYIDAALANYVRFSGNPAGALVEFTSAVGAKKVKIGADDSGDLYVGTQTTT